MSDYVVLSRKYRPKSFSELVGQEAIVQTLTNAITLNKIHHAYLLTGIRGIGKTTTARIIAKNLNCEQGMTTQPCGTCFNCVGIANGSHPDIFEFDAASNTGIDDVKTLLEGISYAPVSARKKIYIIDEVHMLSTKAFNSLLKTLEEPPQNVVFIFATTEVNKVPATILSRCQKFYLRSLSVEEITLHLKHIAQQEGYQIDDEAAKLLAIKADGSARDSISLLDQAIINKSLEEVVDQKTIKKDEVFKMLNMVDKSEIIDLLEHIISGKMNEIFQKLNILTGNANNELIVVHSLMEVLHAIAKLKCIPNDISFVTLSTHEQEKISVFAKVLPMPIIISMWQILLIGCDELAGAIIPKSKLDMIVIKLCYCITLPSPAEIVKRLQDKDVNTALNSLTNSKLLN